MIFDLHSGLLNAANHLIEDDVGFAAVLVLGMSFKDGKQKNKIYISYSSKYHKISRYVDWYSSFYRLGLMVYDDLMLNLPLKGYIAIYLCTNYSWGMYVKYKVLFTTIYTLRAKHIRASRDAWPLPDMTSLKRSPLTTTLFSVVSCLLSSLLKHSILKHLAVSSPHQLSIMFAVRDEILVTLRQLFSFTPSHKITLFQKRFLW